MRDGRIVRISRLGNLGDDPKEEWGGVNLDQFFVDEDFDRGCNYTGNPGSMRAGCPYLVRRQTR